MHLLKNGQPAHVFTDEDRRKAAAVTNEIRREKRKLLETIRMQREIAEMVARDEARRQRRREKRRARAREKRYSPRPPSSTTFHHSPAHGELSPGPANERQALELGLVR